MCILALITNYNARFPFILITNRDEVLSRVTHPLGIDGATGLLWAVDGVAGGSWLGLELIHGRLATVTNCRRGPLAPLMGRPPLPPPWRGAMLLSEALAHTASVGSGRTRHLVYTPPTSRGTIIRRFLMEGLQPGEGETAMAAAAATETAGVVDKETLLAVPQTLRPPFYAGYNLVTCNSLFGETSAGGNRPFTARFTTNRYAVECGAPLAHGEVHCLQNSFMDNWIEPKTSRLRESFTEVLRTTIDPYLTRTSCVVPLSTSEAERIATTFADRCLNEKPQFDVRAMLTDPSRKVAARERMTLAELIGSTDAQLGFTEEELREYFPPPAGSTWAESPVTDGGAADRECYLQRNIFTEQRDGYGTRVQSVVFVEKTGSGRDYTTHFCQRAAGSNAWMHYAVSDTGEARLVSTP